MDGLFLSKTYRLHTHIPEPDMPHGVTAENIRTALNVGNVESSFRPYTVCKSEQTQYTQ